MFVNVIKKRYPLFYLLLMYSLLTKSLTSTK